MTLTTTAPKPPSGPSRFRLRPLVRCMAAATVVAGLAASCTPRVETHGNKVDPDRLVRVVPGQTDRNTVAALLGTPSSSSDFGQETWYYVTSKTRSFAFFKDRLESRQIVFVSFAEDGRVDEIGTLSEVDGRQITLVDRETPTAGQEFTVLQQLLGNLGRFNQTSQ